MILLPLLLPLLASSPSIESKPPFQERLRGASESLRIESSAELSLHALLSRLAELTGQTLTMSPEVAQKLQTSRVKFDRAVSVPAEEAYLFVEAFLVEPHLTIAPVAGASPPALGVYTGQELTRETHLDIPQKEVQAYSGHSALLVRTVIDLGTIDPGPLMQTLRALVVGIMRQSMQVLDENKVELTGTGQWVADMAAFFESAVTIEPAEVVWRTKRRPGVPKDSMVLNPDPKHSLAELIARYRQVTGFHVVSHPQTLERLEKEWVRIPRKLEVPREEVHAYVGGCLAAQGFGFAPLHVGRETVLMLIDHQTSWRGGVPYEPMPVSVAEVRGLAERPDLWTRTLVDMQDLDARMVQTQLRAIVSDTATQRITSIGNRLIIRGSGSYVADVVDVLGILMRQESDTSPQLTKSLPAAKQELVLSAGEMVIARLLERLADATGQHLAMSASTRKTLEQGRIVVPRKTEVPAEDAYAYVEACLRDFGCVLVPSKGGTCPLLGVYGLRPSKISSAIQHRRVKAFAGAFPIPPDRVDEFGSHAALWARTVLHLDNVGTRTLQTQLRALITDTTIEGFMAAGENRIILYGCAQKLRNLVNLLLAVNRSSGFIDIEASEFPTAEFPDATAPLVLLEEELTLGDMLNAYSECTGLHIVQSERTARLLDQGSIDIGKKTEIPPEDTHAFVQAILNEHGFGVEPILDIQEPLVRVYSHSTRNRGNQAPQKTLIKSSAHGTSHSTPRCRCARS